MSHALQALPEYLARHVSAKTQYYTLPTPLALERGGYLEQVTLAYRTWGNPVTDTDRPVEVARQWSCERDVGQRGVVRLISREETCETGIMQVLLGG